MVQAVEVATKCKLPLVVLDNGRVRVIVAARHVAKYGRVYITFEDDSDEIDVPLRCHFELR